MMDGMDRGICEVDSMPRGGPDASRLDRWLQTDSPSALRALARYADPGITLNLRGGPLKPQIVVASRSRAGQDSQVAQPNSA
jgi:hypothetical protein